MKNRPSRPWQNCRAAESGTLLWVLAPALATVLLVHFTTTLGHSGILDPELIAGSRIADRSPASTGSMMVFLKVTIVALVFLHMTLLVLIRPDGWSRLSDDLSLNRLASNTLIIFSFFQLSFIQAGFFFSDDALRHIVDGYHLLHGGDVYSVSARLLGPVAGFLPNHPESATIYLPITQLQTILGTLISERYGFIIVYHLTIIGCSWWIHTLLKPHERPLFLLLLLSPIFLITSSSRHADVQGLLLILLLLLLLRAGVQSIYQTGKRVALRFRSMVFLAAGLVAGSLPGLKPEGILWSLAAFLFVLFIPDPLGGERSGQRALSRRERTFFFLLGVAGVLLVQLSISLIYMFPTPESRAGFLKTGGIYLNLFFAYNPFVFWRMNGNSVSPYPYIRDHRNDLIALVATIMVLILLRLNTAGESPGERSSVRTRMYEYGKWILAISTITAVMIRGAWHPWYFLWILPALHLLERTRMAIIGLQILPLFYLAVVDLRFRGEWRYQETYSFLIIFLGGWLLLTEYAQNTMLRIWERIRSRF